MSCGTTSTNGNKEKIKEIVFEHSARLHQWSLPSGIVMDVELAIEEILANILIHGYHDEKIKMENEVRVDMELKDDFIEIRIFDRGRYFDINSYKKPDLTTYLDSSINGGFGAALVRKVMDVIECKREGNTNTTLLRKLLKDGG